MPIVAAIILILLIIFVVIPLFKVLGKKLKDLVLAFLSFIFLIIVAFLFFAVPYIMIPLALVIAVSYFAQNKKEKQSTINQLAKPDDF